MKVVFFVIGIVLFPVPNAAVAHEEHLVYFEAPVPGTVLVPYWSGDILCIGCNPDGTVRRALGGTPWGDEPLVNPRMLVELCDRPFPPGSWDAEHLGAPPPGAGLIAARVHPVVDWDFAVCTLRGPTEWELRSDPEDTDLRWRLDAFSANLDGRPCQNVLGVPEVPIGCEDRLSAKVTAGLQYKIVAYNWSDVLPAPGWWRWL